MSMTQTLTEFTVQVNRLTHEKCARLNASGTRLFSAQHYDYPESMMKLYFDKGFTAQEYMDLHESQNEADGRAEALAS